MIKNHYELALELLNYFNSSRGIGHTTAMLSGTLHTQNAKIVIHSHEMQEVLRNMCEGETPNTVSLDEIVSGKLRETRTPIVFDNHAIFSILSSLTSTIAVLRKDNDVMKNKIQLARQTLH